MMREFVEIAAPAAEIAGVLIIVGGLLFAAGRYAFVLGLIVLGIIVVIRTFLSWSLALELDGRWPWQRGAAQTHLS